MSHPGIPDYSQGQLGQVSEQLDLKMFLLIAGLNSFWKSLPAQTVQWFHENQTTLIDCCGSCVHLNVSGFYLLIESYSKKPLIATASGQQDNELPVQFPWKG